MIFEGIEQFRASGFDAQVAVIGSGPAGITVARRLAKAGIPNVLLDAGGLDYSPESQDFYRGEVIGDPYFELDHARLRFLGGTSGHWSGWCRLMDAHDFESRDWIPNSGWPISRAAIEPYFAAARETIGLRPFDEDALVSEDMMRVDLIRSHARLFGDYYRDELSASEQIAVVLNTYATDLEAESGQIARANLFSNGARAGALEVPRFVIATGGIENSRLLLWSNEVSAEPVVAEPRALGRYWMEHPEFTAGDALISDTSSFKTYEDGWAYFSPTPSAMERLGIMNFHARIMPDLYSGAKKVVADLACTAPGAARWFAESLGQNIACGTTIGVAFEQAPEFDNRVALSAGERDAAGVPLTELHWRKGELERKTVTEGLKLFGATLASKEIGRMRMASWLVDGDDYPENDMLAGYHHMGGTRMSDDPKTGIVDADCRVHGMGNLYVAGSSVFTTGGYVNPTLTIVTLAERLGAHLASQMN